MKFSRVAVIIYPLLIWLLAQAYFIWPEVLYISLAVSLVLTLATSFAIKSPERDLPWWLPAILPIFFITAMTIYVALQPSWILVQLLFLVLLIFIFNYYKNLYYFWQRPDLYEEEDNTRIEAYGGFLTIFLAAADLYGLQSLLSLTVWPMMIIFTVIVLVIAYLNLNLKNQDRKTIWQFAAMITFLIIEMALVFVFLPLSYNVSALSLGIVYYLLINLSRLYLQQALTNKKIKLYLIISYTGLAILLFTARWLN